MSFKKIIIGADHAGFQLKRDLHEFLDEMGFATKDLGVYNEELCDYPQIARSVCKMVLLERDALGILVCGTGAGMSIAANKILGIRAVCCSDLYTAKLSREHNNANILCLGSRVIESEVAIKLTETFVRSEFLGEERHLRRIAQISVLEKEQTRILN